MKKIKGPKFFKLLAGALGITPTVCTLASCDLLQPETGFTTGYAPPYDPKDIPGYGDPTVLGPTVIPTQDLFNKECFDGCGIQIWNDNYDARTCDVDPQNGSFTAGDAWGGAIGCSLGGYDSTGDNLVSSFGMNGVTELECFVSSNATGTLTLTPEGDKGAKQDVVTVELPCNNLKVSIPHKFSPMNDTQIILNVTSEGTKPGDTVYIQDIRFKNSYGEYLRVERN